MTTVPDDATSPRDSSTPASTLDARARTAGVVACALAVLALGGVACFLFPAPLTTPALRAVYPIPLVRGLLRGVLVLSAVLGVIDVVVRRRVATWGAAAAVISVVTLLLGGADLPTQSVPKSSYVGLDWFLLDVVFSGLVFVPLERLFAQRPRQPIARAEWQTDAVYFFIGHLLIEATAWLTITPALVFFHWAARPGVQQAIAGQPFAWQLVEIVVVADLAQYAAHRLAHRVPFLWRIHAVHHSCETMDWLAGSRLHLADVVFMRAATFAPIFVLGFARDVVAAYLVLVALHAVFIHANVRGRYGILEEVFVTPRFHHWHHAAADDAIDTNFAVHLAFLDRLFGTRVRGASAAQGAWPERYGLSHGDERMPNGYFAQFAYPFRRRNRAR